jgi:HlyD family secretion protein
MSPDKQQRGPGKWLWVLALCLVCASAFPIFYSLRAEHPAPATADAVKDTPIAVSCLGRVEPQGGVLHVAGTYVLGHPPVVESLQVKEGQWVGRGALLAILAGRSQLTAALAQARAQTAVARRRLEQIRAGSRKADLAAQQSEIARLGAVLQNAQAELRRYEALRRTDDVTASELDARSTALLVAQRALEQARHRLESLQEVPESDVRVAEAQVQAAIADEQRAGRDYELSAVYSPVAGQVLKIRAYPGEQAGADGILDMRRTGPMYVVAEVYETDIGRVRPGQHATISGDLLSAPLSGTVERIGTNVKAASVVAGDTASFSDARIVEARIRLDQGEAVAGLVGGKVTVVIRP